MADAITVFRPKHDETDTGDGIVDISIEGQKGKLTLVFDKPVTHLELDGRDAAILLVGLIEAGTLAFKANGENVPMPTLN